jgi:hypothetical protein
MEMRMLLETGLQTTCTTLSLHFVRPWDCGKLSLKAERLVCLMEEISRQHCTQVLLVVFSQIGNTEKQSEKT